MTTLGAGDKRDGVVIIGASVAGLAVAQGLRQRGYEGPVTLVGQERHLPYDRPPLSKQFLAGDWDTERLMLCTAEELAAASIDVRLGVPASELRVADRHVVLADGTALPFDDIVIATGVRPRMPAAWDGIDGVLTVRTLDDITVLKGRLDAATHVAIVGAGFIGAEAAAVLRTLDHDVTLIDPLAYPMAGVLPPALADLLLGAHRGAGVDVRCGVAVDELLQDAGRVTGIQLSDGTHVAADLVIIGLGATPNVEWLAGSGLALDNGVICDSHCRAGDRVYAAGDVCSWEHTGIGRQLRIEHRMHAAEQAGYVANLIAGGDDEPFAPVPFFWTDQVGLRLQVFGWVAATDELDVLQGSIESGRFVSAVCRGDEVVGVLGVNMPKQTRQATTFVGGQRGALSPV